jgi:GntR family transcriptional regulator / MocR family aminotransferase
MSPPVSAGIGAKSLIRHGLPLQEQIYRRVRAAIANGQLSPGERVPSARALAGELGVARGTVDAAYARLIGEGYLLPRGAAGTVVSPALRAEQRAADGERTAIANRRHSAPLPFQMGLPALDAFPRTLWSRLTGQMARRLGPDMLAYPDPAGLPALREAISAYLAVSRGVACRPEQIVVTGGYQDALAFLARLLLRPDDAVWFEEPGYFKARRVLQAVGAHLVPVPVDEQGMQVELGATHAPRARLAVVTPAHQSPLGMALSLPRREALLAWADTAQAWILEDDYDSEFHYVGRKPPALKSLDAADRVIYAGSFSKTLFPGLRLGYAVLPAALVERATVALETERHGEDTLRQMVAAEFILQGHFARHLKRMRGLYGARQKALADALAEAFGAEVQLSLQRGGMHLLARFPGQGDDADMMRRATASGLAPLPLSSQYLGSRREHGLLLGFTNIPEPQADAMAQRLLRALHGQDH